MTFTLFKPKPKIDIAMAAQHYNACMILLDFCKDEIDDAYIDALVYNSAKYWAYMGTPKTVTKEQVLIDIRKINETNRR